MRAENFFKNLKKMLDKAKKVWYKIIYGIIGKNALRVFLTGAGQIK